LSKTGLYLAQIRNLIKNEETLGIIDIQGVKKGRLHQGHVFYAVRDSFKSFMYRVMIIN